MNVFILRTPAQEKVSVFRIPHITGKACAAVVPLVQGNDLPPLCGPPGGFYGNVYGFAATGSKDCVVKISRCFLCQFPGQNDPCFRGKMVVPNICFFKCGR